MTATLRPATAADAERLASLHGACLPESLLSALGAPLVVRYYEFLAGSPTEDVVVAALDGTVQAGCVISRAPASLLSRFVRAAPIAFSRALARELRASSVLRRRMWQRLRDPGAAGPALPEVVQIFTAARARGRGLGAQLLRATEGLLRGFGEQAYTVRTRRDDNAAGIRFYDREGFAVIGEARSFGDHYLVLHKGL